MSPREEEPGGERVEPALAPRRSRWRGVRRLAVLLAVMVVVAAVALAVSFERIARWYVLQEAAARGVQLSPRELKVEWGRVSLFDVGVTLDGVPDLSLEVAYVEVRAEGLVPREIIARGVAVRARSADAALQLLAYGRAHASELVPLRATDLRLALIDPTAQAASSPSSGAPGGEAPVIDARVASVTILPGEPAQARAVQVDVPRPRATIGPLDLVVSASESTLDVALGSGAAASPLRVLADLEARRLTLTLKPTPAQTLASWMGRAQEAGAPPWPGVFSVEAKGSAGWSPDPGGDLQGSLDATLLGLVPPVPAELSGIVFGANTRASLDFRIRPTEAAIALERLEVSVGSLRLRGTGAVLLRGDTFSATAQLRGAIPCADLVGSAAVARLGLPLGAGLGSIAQLGLAGSVDVRLTLAVDGATIQRPVVQPSASVHCRLRIPGR